MIELMEPNLTQKNCEPGYLPQPPENHYSNHHSGIGERLMRRTMRSLAIGAAVVGTALLAPAIGSADPIDHGWHDDQAALESNLYPILRDDTAPIGDTEHAAVQPVVQPRDQARGVNQNHVSSTGLKRGDTAKLSMPLPGTTVPPGPTAAEFNIADSTSTNSNIGCFWIMDSPWDYYEGEACAGDIMFVEDTNEQSGDDYGLILVSGISKCGYMQPGVILSFKAKGKLEDACQPYYHKLTI